jgi:hypothetical protein
VGSRKKEREKREREKREREREKREIERDLVQRSHPPRIREANQRHPVFSKASYPWGEIE